MLAIEIEEDLNRNSKNGRPKLNIHRVSTCLLALLSLGNLDGAHSLFRVMERGLESRLFYDAPEVFSVAQFAMRLGRDLAGSTDDDSTVYCEAYKRLLDNWRTTDAAEISDLMVDALNQHQKLSGDRANAEFERPVYWIFPVEVCAVIRLRKADGLSTPPLVHPLMESPLCRLTASRQLFEDSLLKRVDQRVKSSE